MSLNEGSINKLLRNVTVATRCTSHFRAPLAIVSSTRELSLAPTGHPA